METSEVTRSRSGIVLVPEPANVGELAFIIRSVRLTDVKIGVYRGFAVVRRSPSRMSRELGARRTATRRRTRRTRYVRTHSGARGDPAERPAVNDVTRLRVEINVLGQSRVLQPGRPATWLGSWIKYASVPGSRPSLVADDARRERLASTVVCSRHHGKVNRADLASNGTGGVRTWCKTCEASRRKQARDAARERSA